MRYVLTMAVSNGLQDLLANMRSLVLGQVFTFADLIEELTTFTQFRDQEDGTPILVDLIKPDNIRMSQVLEDVNFVHEASLFGLIKLQLVDHLDCAHLTISLVRGLLNLAKGT